MSTVNEQTTATFLLAVRLANPDVAIPSVIMTDMDLNLSNAFNLAYPEEQLPRSYWCLFHVFQAWFKKLDTRHSDDGRGLYTGLKGLAVQSTEENFTASLALLRNAYSAVVVKSGKNTQLFYYDQHYARFEVSMHACSNTVAAVCLLTPTGCAATVGTT